MKWHNSALLIFCYALSFGIFAHVFPNGINLHVQDFQRQRKVENCDTLIIFDFSNQVTKENIFNISIKTFLQFILDNCKTFKYISIDNNFNGCKNSNLCNVTTMECNSSNGCDIKNLDYNTILSSYSADLVHDDITTIKNYFTFLNKIFSQTSQCESNSVLLLTNRIVPMNNDSIINQPTENIFKTLTPILLGRNDANATGILQNAYENIKVAKTLNLPNYDCLNYLFYCILSCSNNTTSECLKTDIADCQERSTFMPNDKLDQTLHIWCIFAVANKSVFDESAVYSVVSQLQTGITAFREKTGITQSRIKVFFDEKGYFTEDMVTLLDAVPHKDIYPYIDISTDNNNSTTDNNQFNQRLNLIPWSSTLTEKRPGIWFIFIATNYGTDDFKPLSNDSHLWGQINIYKDSEAYDTYLQKLQNDTFVNLVYQAIEGAAINIIPLNYNETVTTTTATTVKFLTASTSTEISTTSGFSLSSSHKRSKILLICGSIAGILIIIIVVTVLIIYRIKKRNSEVERMQISHGRPQLIRRNHLGRASSYCDNWELTWDRLVIKNDELSTGANEQLLHGALLSDFRNGAYQSSSDVAIKMPNKHALQIDRDRFLNEISMMKQISGHDNIIKILGSITKEQQICLVMEFCSNLDLFNYVKEIKYNENEFEEYKKQKKKEFFIFSWQILHGMEYLNSKLIIHRNITANNILIDSGKNAKITDFGLAVHETEKMKTLSSFDKEKLPTKWLAIEVLKNWEFGFQSDIWAFGVTLYEMYSFGEIPYAHIETEEILDYLEAGNRLEKPDFCSDKIFEIMSKCWCEDPSTRPTTKEIIKDFTEFLEQYTEGYGYLELESAINEID